MGVAHNVGVQRPFGLLDAPLVALTNYLSAFAWTDAIQDHLDFMGLNYYGQVWKGRGGGGGKGGGMKVGMGMAEWGVCELLYMHNFIVSVFGGKECIGLGYGPLCASLIFAFKSR